MVPLSTLHFSLKPPRYWLSPLATLLSLLFILSPCTLSPLHSFYTFSSPSLAIIFLIFNFILSFFSHTHRLASFSLSLFIFIHHSSSIILIYHLPTSTIPSSSCSSIPPFSILIPLSISSASHSHYPPVTPLRTLHPSLFPRPLVT